jgi:lysophospholipase L1-like esterase
MAAAGCGGGRGGERAGSEPVALDRPASKDSAQVLVAALGDSILAGSPAWDPDPGVRATLGTGANERSQLEYWAERAEPRLRFRNCGVFGERTDQIATRLESCARGASVLLIQGGINDIAQGRSADDAAGDVRAMIRRGRELGLRVAVTDILPWNNGYPDAAPAIRRLNARLREIARAERVPLLPFNATLEDPSRPDRMRADWTADGDHPSVEGYRRLGEMVAKRLPR